jgi:hypothetical protein
MLKFSAYNFYHIGRFLARLEAICRRLKSDDLVDDELIGIAKDLTSEILKDCTRIGLTMSVKAEQRALESFAKGITHGEMRQIYADLNQRISDEIEGRFFLHLSSEEATFHEKPLDGWDDVVTAFPSTIFDIEEASKDIAFGRATSAAFHLMRVFGAGVKTLGKSLNEPTLDASHNLTWDNVLSRCSKELSEKYSGKSPEWQKKKEFYAAATTTLLGVKDAWRNPNAHEVGQKYTEEEALDIYRATRAFMRQLSKELKENP